MSKTFFNIAGMQIGWFACALGAADGYPWAGPAVVALYLAVFLFQSSAPRQDAGFILLAALAGAIIDGLLRGSGFMIYHSAVPAIDWLAPVWIVAMWMLFATTFNASLRWLRQQPLSALLLGLLFGPLSYYAGERLGAIDLTYPHVVSLPVLALLWGAVMVGLVYLSRYVYDVR